MDFELWIRPIQRLAHGPGFSLPGLAVASALLALSLLIVPSPAQADLAAGVTAYDRGDLQTAFREFSISTRQSDAEARYRLAVMYANGVGTLGNDLLAYKWLRTFFGLGNGKWCSVSRLT